MLDTSSENVSLRSIRRLAMVSAISVFTVIVAGGILRSMGSASACLGWPVCGGSFYPPSSVEGLLEYTHKAGSLLLVPIFLMMSWVALRRFRQARWLVLPVVAAVFVLTAQVLWGGLVSSRLQSDARESLTAVHFGLSLLIQILVVIPVVLAYYVDRGVPPGRLLHSLRRPSPFTKLTLASLAGVFLLLVSGAIVSAYGAEQACRGWPLCGNGFLPGTSAEWLNMIHRLVVLAAAVLLGWQFIQAWRTQRSQPAVLTAATAASVLFTSQALLGAYQVAQGFPIFMITLHQATAVAVLVALGVQTLALGMAGRTAEEERKEAAGFRGRKGLVRDFLMLTKPIVVALLLVTTFAGMVIGARAWPSFSLVFWTLLGGAMAAGGSGAINQYIDRFDDQKMQRTERRPIPSGRLEPAEGLAFGVGISLGAFFLVVVFVNLLAALLVLAGIIYYVLIYSIFLKKTTVQNIVIGGGAGAIPPLVGWAAATGSLNIPSLFLFAVVFMWTPPHFWALALVRRKDYARAGVPMLPVVRGENETRWQIFLYTVELVALTLLLPLFGLGGSIYLVSAGLLGGLLMYSAWKVWKQGGNRLAWKMYRYSSMYLAFLFLALMVDALVLG
jgi:heme o synthase